MFSARFCFIGIIWLCFGYACSSSTSTVAVKLPIKKEKIAVLPFQVEIKLRKSNKQVFTDEQINELRLYFTNSLQEYMIYRLQKTADKKQLPLTFISAEEINNILSSKQVTYGNLFVMNKKEITTLLGADEIIFSSASFGQPFSDDVSDLGFFLAGLDLPSNDLTITSGVFRSSSDSLLWKYTASKTLSVLGQPFGDFRYIRIPANQYQQVINPMMSNVAPAVKEFVLKYINRRKKI